MHQTSGRWRYGLLLSLTTALLWGLLPLGLKGTLVAMDPVTVTWYRFLVAGIFIFIYLLLSRGLPNLRFLRGAALLLAAVCIVSLSLNYNFYIFGLETIPPSTAQVTIQFAPMLLLIGGVVIFRERFSRIQTLGLLTFVIGIVLFFNLRLNELFSSLTAYTTGVLWIVAAAITWAVYALTQKELLKVFPSAAIMLMIYVCGTLLMLPFAAPEQIAQVSGVEWGFLIFCCLNTIIGYGAFAEALNHWEASRVSAVLALQPLITIFFNRLLHNHWPEYWPVETINAWSILGAFLVVVGSMLTALHRRADQQ